jgi:transposase-like protein
MSLSILIFMERLTPHEQQKYIVIKEYDAGKLTRKQAALRLGVRAETVSRLVKAYRQHGKQAFVHKNHGNHYAVHVSPEVEAALVRLYQTDFEGFNFTHFYEMVRDGQSIPTETLPSSRTVYAILKRHGITSPVANRVRRPPNSHPIRPRRQSFGELVQLDGSFHDWLGLGAEHKITLHAAIDDATSRILAGWFEPQETLHGYYQITKQILEAYGIPQTFYTDRRTVFAHVSTKQEAAIHTQFQAACSQLGIELLATSSPQAKGRIERSFRTMQDRLLHELRYHNIATIDHANQFLKGYIQRHNARFAHDPVACSNAFKALDDYTAAHLDKVLAVTEPRHILQGNVVSYQSKQYIPVASDGAVVALPPNTTVTVVQTLGGELYLQHDQSYYKLIWTADGRYTAHPPHTNHPWRRWSE